MNYYCLVHSFTQSIRFVGDRLKSFDDRFQISCIGDLQTVYEKLMYICKFAGMNYMLRPEYACLAIMLCMSFSVQVFKYVHGMAWELR